MWRLITLGGLALERVRTSGPDSPDTPLPDVAAARRPLALLATLAIAGERGVSRERLLLYFWPDSGVERARNALRQTTFRIRRDLGDPDPILGAGELRLNTDAIAADCAEFEAAVLAGDLERAAALYGGPFLHGVLIADAPEFEEWMSAERARLGQRFTHVVESLAAMAEARGDHEAAVGWWRRLAAIDPTNSRVAVGLMTALAACGDRAGALQYYRLHELLLQEELGVSGDETVLALVNKLRTEHDEVAVGPAHALQSGAEGDVTIDIAHSPIAAGRWTRFSPRRLGPVVPLLMAAAVVIAFAMQRAEPLSSGGSVGAEPNVVAVFPFGQRGGPEDDHIGVAVSDLLSADLSGAGPLQVADRHVVGASSRGLDVIHDPSAARLIATRQRARRFVLGEVTAAGDRIAVTATVYALRQKTSGNPQMREIAASGSRAQITAVVDTIAREILAEAYQGPSERLARTAAATAASVAALKSYLVGEQYFVDGRYASAVEALQRAVRLDTSFALAYYRLSVAADWASHPTLPTESVVRALRFVDELPEHEQRLVRAFGAWRRGDGAEALQLYRLAVSEQPDDAEAWYQLGEVLFHAGPAYGHSVVEARAAFERALGFRPGARESLVHLVRLAAKVRDNRAVDTLAHSVLALDSTRDATEMRLFLAIADRDSAARTQVLESLRASPDEAVLTAAWRAGTFAEDLTFASEVAAILIDPSRNLSYQATGRWYVASLDVARGHWASARSLLAPGGLAYSQPNATAADSTVARRGSVDALHAGQLGLLAVAPLVARPLTELRALKRRAVLWPSAPPELANWYNVFEPSLRDYVLGLLSVRMRDTAAVARYAARLERLRGEGGLTENAAAAAITLRAELARVSGQPDDALALLESMPITANISTVMGSRAYERFLRAELLHELGRDDEALRWYATQGQSFIPDMTYLAPAHLRQAQIFEHKGDRARAAAHYRRFVELWGDCDPDLRPIVDAARQHLARLGGR